MKPFLKSKLVLTVTTLVLIAAGTLTMLPRQPAAHAASGDWPALLANNGRTGFNGAETIINPTTAPNLKLHWTHSTAGRITAEPIEANGMVYWGSWDGVEHASRLSDGTDVWTANLGAMTGSCSHQPHGVVSTATLAPVSINGVTTPVDFVGGGNNNFYALNASTAATIWHTLLGSQTGDYIWSSPAVFHNSVYIGESSFGDCPLVRGKLIQLNVSTGAIQHTFYTVPKGCLGATVWSSPTIDQANNIVYISTGNEGTCSTSETLSDALVALRTTDLSLVSAWQVPASEQVFDGDFGTTPTFFKATIGGIVHKMIGLMNKNGMYYAFDRTTINAGPIWQDQLAAPATNGENNVSSSSWDGVTLYAAAASTTINGASCMGSLRALNPASGAFLWQDCLGHDVPAPVIAVPGLVEVGSGPSFIIVDATTGKQLFSFQDTHPNSNFAGPASISNGVLYQGNIDGNLYAFGT